jgi:hypothetical protein
MSGKTVNELIEEYKVCRREIQNAIDNHLGVKDVSKASKVKEHELVEALKPFWPLFRIECFMASGQNATEQKSKRGIAMFFTQAEAEAYLKELSDRMSARLEDGVRVEFSIIRMEKFGFTERSYAARFNVSVDDGCDYCMKCIKCHMLDAEITEEKMDEEEK